MSYFKNPEKVEGGQRKVEIRDDNTQELLEKILQELMKINMHLAILSDNDIRDEEIDRDQEVCHR